MSTGAVGFRAASATHASPLDRLQPWLTRELSVLIGPTNRDFVRSFILDLLARFSRSNHTPPTHTRARAHIYIYVHKCPRSWLKLQGGADGPACHYAATALLLL